MQGKIFPNKDALDLGIWCILVWPYDCLESKHKQEFYFFKPYCCAIISHVMSELSDEEDFFFNRLQFLEQF